MGVGFEWDRRARGTREWRMLDFDYFGNVSFWLLVHVIFSTILGIYEVIGMWIIVDQWLM